MNHLDSSCTRRQMVRSLMAGSLLLPGILSHLMAADGGGVITDPNSVIPRQPHFPGKAKRVIFLYMTGGVSHMDSFDPKPRLIADGGKPTSDRPGAPKYLSPLWGFKPGGKCGTEVSDLFPNIRECMDDICLVRSMRGDHQDHFQATLGLHTG